MTKNNKIIKKLNGANIDIDLASEKKEICGIEYLDNVLCCYPNENPNKGSE